MEWFTWDGGLPANAPQDLKLAGVQVGQDFLRGFKCFDIPLGHDKYVIHQLQEKAEEIFRDAEKTIKVSPKSWSGVEEDSGGS